MSYVRAIEEWLYNRLRPFKNWVSFQLCIWRKYTVIYTQKHFINKIWWENRPKEWRIKKQKLERWIFEKVVIDQGREKEEEEEGAY